LVKITHKKRAIGSSINKLAQFSGGKTSKNKKPQKWGPFVLVAGAGFEPTTFGL
jgi:hypothetical protein